jgi:hypothetical protein
MKQTLVLVQLYRALASYAYALHGPVCWTYGKNREGREVLSRICCTVENDR